MSQVRRAALYARVSTVAQTDGVSLEAQEQLAKAWCEANNADLADCYVDVISGTKDQRPALKRLERDLQRFDLLLVYKIDRLARSPVTFYRVLDLLQKRGVALVSLTEAIDDSAGGRAMVGMLSTFAALFSDQLSERMTAVMRVSAAKGAFLGGPMPLGYGPGWEVVEPEAAIVREVFSLYEQVGNLHRVAVDLNGRRLFGRKGKPWVPQTVRCILKQPAYCGDLAWGRKGKGEVVLVRDHHAPLIDRARWEAVQVPGGKRWLGQEYTWRRLLHCGCCGLVLGARPSGHGSICYLCPRRPSRGCPDKTLISDAQLSRLVMPAIWEALAPYSDVTPAVSRASDPSRRVAALEARKEREMNLYRAGYVSWEPTHAAIAAIDAQIREALQAPAPEAPMLPANIRELWAAAKADLRRKMLLGLIARVEVDPTRVIVQLHGELPDLVVTRKSLSGRHSKRRTF